MLNQSFPQLPEESSGIYFSSEDTPFSMQEEEPVARWLEKIIEQEGKRTGLLNFIFCSDEYLYQLNIEYLDHDTLTDVITFPYGELPLVEGDIFISVDRVRENAEQFAVPFEQELSRVMVHGVLHLCGYGDKTEEEVRVMRGKEDEALAILEKRNTA